jgi:hypothetical protein
MAQNPMTYEWMTWEELQEDLIEAIGINEVISI